MIKSRIFKMNKNWCLNLPPYFFDSPLQCKPECPQEDYVYEYEYYGSKNPSATSSGGEDTVDTEVASSREPKRQNNNKPIKFQSQGNQVQGNSFFNSAPPPPPPSPAGFAPISSGDADYSVDLYDLNYDQNQDDPYTVHHNAATSDNFGDHNNNNDNGGGFAAVPSLPSVDSNDYADTANIGGGKNLHCIV